MNKIVLAVFSMFLMVSPSFAGIVTPVKSKGSVPYNVVVVDEENYDIQVLVPGYDKSELTASVKGLYLSLTSEVSNDYSNYQVKNFNKKNFSLGFNLMKDSKVVKVSLSDGILTIRVVHPLTDTEKTKKINIE